MKTTGTKFTDGTESKTGCAALETTVTSKNRLSESANSDSSIDKTLQEAFTRFGAAQVSEFVEPRIGALLRVAGATITSSDKDSNQPALRFQLAGLSAASKQEIIRSVETILKDMVTLSATNSQNLSKREKHKLTLIDHSASHAANQTHDPNAPVKTKTDIDKNIAAALAHKLNNYSAAILSATEQLQENSASTPESDYSVLTGIIMRASRIQTALVNRFLKVFGPVQPQLQKCNLHQCFRSTLGLLQESQHREITYFGENSQICGLTDRVLLENICSELVLNAIEAAPEGPVEFKWQTSRSRLIITVKNTNNGTHDDIYSQLFQPFTSTKPGHAGLGLNVALRSAEALGGTIRPLITPEQVVFTVSIPIQIEEQTNSHTERNN